MKGRGLLDPGIVLLILIAAAVILTGLFLYGKVRVDRLESALEAEEPLSLMLIVSEGEKILFSDILLYQGSTGKGALVDIPPITGSMLEDQRKIGAIEALFDPDDPGKYVAKAGEIAGLDIQFYLNLDLDELSRVVDLIGGVETFIPNPVDTRIDGRLVLLPSGSFVLDGSKAALFLRYGDPGETDSERISRGQGFFQSLLDALGRSSGSFDHKEMSRAFMSGLSTNLSMRGLVSFAEAMDRLDAANMVQLRLRGTIRNVDGTGLLFPHSEGRLLRETLNQTINSLKSENLLSEDDLRIILEIQNGTAVNGLASRTSQLYQSFGYEIVRVGNAQDTYEKTVIIDRIGNQQAVKRVADVIRCTNISVQAGDADYETNLNMTADVIIILGKDFDGRYCKE